jgi:2-polyprenyl-3-methyl-5-hydroxy-6-metoxy-1,4-benzoquinol methylase
VYQTARHLIRPHDYIYDKIYYDNDVESEAFNSANVMARSMVQCFRPKTVIDIGCGTGALLAAFKGLNCEVKGLEYSEAGLAYCRKRNLSVRKFNIEKDSLGEEQYDLAVSFEVAEHLPAWSAKRYVKLLCKLSPLVVMSAATPGQGGRDHINEQPHSYWQRKFDVNGYSFDQDTSKKFSKAWRAAGAAFWYCDNVMVFLRR